MRRNCLTISKPLTTIEVDLLLNFGPKAETKRKTFDNERKGSLAWIKK